MSSKGSSLAQLSAVLSLAALSFFIALSITMTACKSLPTKDEPDYGLRRVSLDLSPEEAGKLNAQIQSKRPVRADIRIEGEPSVSCQVAYAGRGTLDYYRKSFDLYLCSSLYQRRNLYRASAQSFDPSVLRAFLAYPLYSHLGIEVPIIEPASLYVNRAYRGLYLFTEVVDQDFFKAHGLDMGIVYKARYGNAGFKTEFVNRLNDAFSVEGEDDFALLREVYELTITASDEEAYAAQLGRFVDVDQFLRYMAASIYACQWDGMHNNYFLAFDRAIGRLTMYPWDMDRTWEDVKAWSPQRMVALNEILLRLLRTASSRRRMSQLLGQLEEEFPMSRMQADIQRLGDLTAAAYAADPVLASRSQAEVLAELSDHMRVWFEKVHAFRVLLDAPAAP